MVGRPAIVPYLVGKHCFSVHRKCGSDSAFNMEDGKRLWLLTITLPYAAARAMPSPQTMIRRSCVPEYILWSCIRGMVRTSKSAVVASRKTAIAYPGTCTISKE
jgi:hypothetical protein